MLGGQREGHNHEKINKYLHLPLLQLLLLAKSHKGDVALLSEGEALKVA
jgi:hypothetical protein